MRIPRSAVWERPLLNAMQQYYRLEKVEIGGTEGKDLTESVQFVYASFLEISWKSSP